jgi:hypothetical protein
MSDRKIEEVIGKIVTLIHIILVAFILIGIAVIHKKNDLFKLFLILSFITLAFIGFKRCVLDIIEQKYNGGYSIMKHSKYFFEKLVDIENSYVLHGFAVGITVIMIKLLYLILRNNVCK